MIHFWLIFVNRGDGWEALGTSRGGLDIQAYRSKQAAAADLFRARELNGKGRVRLYKFKPEAFILGASK